MAAAEQAATAKNADADNRLQKITLTEAALRAHSAGAAAGSPDADLVPAPTRPGMFSIPLTVSPVGRGAAAGTWAVMSPLWLLLSGRVEPVLLSRLLRLTGATGFMP